ncbi:MAG: AAA family ATPase, partial [Candidatus Bathyarchaeia archaeon]
MKFAVAGKGGVGKTFIAGTLARLLAREGYNVLAVDADPNINLASSLGIPRDVAEGIVPLSDNAALIEERTGVAPGRSYGSLFRMTPTVSDIVERFGVVGPDGVKLLVMGTVKGGETGCMCPANALLRVLIQHLLIQREDIVVMDMVAGLEHLGRGTARRVDAMLVVVEPTMKSVDTLRRTLKLAAEIEVREVLAVGNKIGSEGERRFIEDRMREMGVPTAAYIPY